MKDFKTILHPGPISTLVLISTITLSTIFCSLMWWPPQTSVLGLISLTSFLTFSSLTMYNFFCAMLTGPGYLPLEWKPVDVSARSKLQICTVCSGFKAPRSHHCRQCGRCVTKMDHHCPWVNGCIGFKNQTTFVGFLVFAVIGCSQATVILSLSLYHAIYRTYYMYYELEAPIVYLGLYSFVWCLFSLGCAFGVSVGVGLLLYYQIKIIYRNRTSIEEWIVEKAEYRRRRNPELPRFIYPYDLGWKANICSVLNMSFRSVGDGITWPIVAGCDQYTLTIEQIDQKNDKRERTKEYCITEEYSGSWCPISKGLAVTCHPPCSDESRIKLYQGDKVRVSRWKKYWLYGETTEYSKNEKSKGWFPRSCAVECVEASACPEPKEASSEAVLTNNFLNKALDKKVK